MVSALPAFKFGRPCAPTALKSVPQALPRLLEEKEAHSGLKARIRERGRDLRDQGAWGRLLEGGQEEVTVRTDAKEHRGIRGRAGGVRGIAWGPLRGMQGEVWLEEGLESLVLELEQRNNMIGHPENHLVTVKGRDLGRVNGGSTCGPSLGL